MVQAEWSFGRDADLMVEIWSTAALLESVIAALLEEPENLRKALEAFREGRGLPRS